MGKLHLGAAVGIALGLFSGCVRSEKVQPGVYWELAEPTSTKYIVDRGEERFVRKRKLFDYVDANREVHSMELTEINIPGGNRWQLNSVSFSRDDGFYKALAQRLPGLANILQDRSIKYIQVEDIYREDLRVGTRFYLPGGTSEDLFVSDIIREKQDALNEKK